MNVTFLNPLFLFGLAAAAIPILIHRLVQRHGKVKKFSAVRLLLLSQQNLVRPERLKEFFLLALRVLAVMSLALLIARPVWLFSGVFSSGEEGAKVLILDNSLSMGYREDRGERFELARAHARDFLRTLKGRALILPTAAVPGRNLEDVPVGWVNPEEALRQLEMISLSFGKGDPETALNRAFQAARDFKGPLEVVILTDLARGEWEGLQPGKLKNVPSNLTLTFVRFGGSRRDPNLTIKDIRLSQGEGVVGTPSLLEVTVANLSGQAASSRVQLHLDDVKVEQKTVDLPAGEDGKLAFDLPLDKPGWIRGQVRLAGDRLPLDDQFYFPLKARERVKILVVDGDPRTAFKASESYYLVNALQPGRGEGTPFSVRVIQEGELQRMDLKPYEAIFLLNVPQPPSSPLASYLQAGKTLFIFLGDRVIPEPYQRLPFFSWQLKEVKEGGVPARILPGAGNLHQENPMSLSGISGESLRKASFERYYRVAKSGRTLLALENGDPLLMEGEWGKGRVFLFVSSADLDWNDLPLNAAFLPLIHGLLKEAVGLSPGPIPPTLRVGDAFPGAGPAMQIAGTPGGPGIYQISPASGNGWRALNPPVEESDLRKMTVEEMKKRWGSMEVRIFESTEGGGGAPLAGRRELWPYILGFLLAVLGIEMGVAGRI
ncbi:MAG: vWA domain-containing protein [Planctomycetaceae bacterium]